MGTNRNILRPGQKERLRKGAIQGSCYYNHFLKDKTFIVVTEDYMYCSITFKNNAHTNNLKFMNVLKNDTLYIV